jgi:hypothetical protein
MAGEPFALSVQLLATEADRAAALGQLLARRDGKRSFTTRELDDVFVELRMPRPANLSRTLGRMRDRGLVMSRDQRWSLTPVGEKYARDLMGEIDVAKVAAELAVSPGAELGHERHALIPPSFAPPRWRQGIGRLLDRYPFETNVFCMTRFPSEEVSDPVAAVIATARDVLRTYGLTLLVADDHQFEDDLLGNIGAYMWACQYGIGLLEDRGGRGLNYNVVIELGSMTITGRRCTMLKDVTSPELPTDLSGQIYKPVDFDDLDDVSRTLEKWVHSDLNI